MIKTVTFYFCGMMLSYALWLLAQNMLGISFTTKESAVFCSIIAGMFLAFNIKQ